MGEINRQIDALELFLTGGASNSDPDDSLGGIRSPIRCRGLGAIITKSIPCIRIDKVFPACGEGEASLLVHNNSLFFTPPEGTVGEGIEISEGESKIISGSNNQKAMRIYRHPGLALVGLSTLKLVNTLNNVFSMGNISDADRQTGKTYYRAVMLKAQGDYGVCEIKLWMPAVGGSQAVFSLGLEIPVGEEIQEIANENTAPLGISFTTPTTEATALLISVIQPNECIGLWIRKVFPPAGTVNPQENFQLTVKYKGA